MPQPTTGNNVSASSANNASDLNQSTTTTTTTTNNRMMIGKHNNNQNNNKHSSNNNNNNLRSNNQSANRLQQQQQQQRKDVQRNNNNNNETNSSATITTFIPEIREYLFKILVIGELGTGKTSFIKRYVHQYFSQYYRATIGVDFALKVLNWDDNILIRLQLWDIAGQERFGNMTRIYYKEAVGAFLVFDVSAPSSFNAVLKWKHDLDTKVCMADGQPIPCLLLANKCDANKEGIAADPEMLEKFCKENNFCGWFYTSAKENTNIEESAKFLVGKILQRQKHFALEDVADNDDVINLAYHNHRVSKSEKCSC
ncbi:rab32, member RAS oncoprotein [Dermatophagoides pteronyssinus]|uniref:Ras-related protein Rab n=1 Tax=Dermatophagoides pteronyssinus TaxID=6956 RepID=A0ABQ8J462_DERPT|nr:rab32, member RAS oncoprotein [Dermatophagoides pteronyssinus]